jgi:ABC-type phosphate transport system substrate-binding protein
MKTTTKTRAWVAMLAIVLSPTPTVKAAAGYQVVVNAANPAPAVTAAQLSRIFLKKATKWDHGAAAIPVDQAADAPVRGEFSRAVHGKPASAVAAYWQQQIFAGRDLPPAEKAGDEAVLAFVRANPGAVGYVSPSATVTGLRVLEVR